jgi:hypothetical protein
VLHIVTIIGTDFDWSAWISVALDLFILAALWLPRASRAFFGPFDPLRT